MLIIYKGNGLGILPDAIDHDGRTATHSSRLRDSDVVGPLPIPVVHPECLPILRKARYQAQLVCFQLEPEE